jgi:hypothetical protein
MARAADDHLGLTHERLVFGRSRRRAILALVAFAAAVVARAGEKRPGHHARLARRAVAVRQRVHQPREVFHTRVFTPPQQLLAQPAAAHLPVPSSEGYPTRGVGVVEPHESLVVLVQEAVLQPEVFELVEPDAVVVHERRVRRDEAHGDAAFRHLRGDREPRGPGADDEDVDDVGAVRLERRERVRDGRLRVVPSFKATSGWS